MKKKCLSIIILILSSVIFFQHCSKQEDILVNKFWVKYKKKGKPNYLVQFTPDGKCYYFNNLAETYNFQIIQNRMIFTNSRGEKEKYFIKSLNYKELKLSDIEEISKMNIVYFKVAEVKDYFLGTWKSINKGSFYELTFDGDGLGKLEEEINGYIAKKELIYTVPNDNIIVFDSTKYKFSFSQDIIDLELIEPGGRKINLTRIK